MIASGDSGIPSSPTPTENSKRGSIWLPCRTVVATTLPVRWETIWNSTSSDSPGSRSGIVCEFDPTTSIPDRPEMGSDTVSRLTGALPVFEIVRRSGYSSSTRTISGWGMVTPSVGSRTTTAPRAVPVTRRISPSGKPSRTPSRSNSTTWVPWLLPSTSASACPSAWAIRKVMSSAVPSSPSAPGTRTGTGTPKGRRRLGLGQPQTRRQGHLGGQIPDGQRIPLRRVVLRHHHHGEELVQQADVGREQDHPGQADRTALEQPSMALHPPYGTDWRFFSSSSVKGAIRGGRNRGGARPAAAAGEVGRPSRTGRSRAPSATEEDRDVVVEDLAVDGEAEGEVEGVEVVVVDDDAVAADLVEGQGSGRHPRHQHLGHQDAAERGSA